jgi:molecular chaperone DnaK (HSP70)
MGCAGSEVIDSNNKKGNSNIVESKKGKNDKNPEKNQTIGINIGALNTVYSIFTNITGKYITYVLLMNNTIRTIKSLICYNSDERLFGDNSKSSIKKNLNTSYNNLSRIIGLKISELNKNELQYMFTKNFKYNWFIDNKKIEEKEESCYIIADFLSLINEYYFVKEKIEYNSVSISVPDFYEEKQKENIKLICEALKMENIKIFNESAAITMYYGYNKYNDLFGDINQIDQESKKIVLFIDIGQSKTSFILSSFTYNNFCIEHKSFIKDIGGRNFEQILFDYCIKNSEFNNIKINENMKYRLFEEIQTKKLGLSSNNLTDIIVYSFYNDNDLTVQITREQYEKESKKLIDEIEKEFVNVIEYSKKINKTIDYVEIAGCFMRTPFLQKMIEKQNLKISKTILIDECTSVGAALLGSFLDGYFPIKVSLFEKENKIIEFKSKNNNEKLKKDLEIHLKQMKEKDELYNEGIELKNIIQKYLNNLNKIPKNNKYNNKFNEIFGKFEKIKDQSTNDNKKIYEKMEKGLKNLSIDIINELIKSNKNKSQELEKIKKSNKLHEHIEEVIELLEL